MIKNRKYRIGFFVVGAIVAVFAFSALVMVLWNALMPQIFGVASLSYWQAMGLFVLAHILIKSGRPYHFLHGMKHERWRKMMDDQICRMTPEQRKAFFQDWDNRLQHFGGSGGTSSDPT